jgi:hypothetical protein
MAKKLVIYEGATCCSTGLCGAEPNMVLVEFSETIDRIQREIEDVDIMRANLSYNIDMFLENDEIFQLVKKNSPSILPITTINGKIISKQRYLNYDELREALTGEDK